MNPSHGLCLNARHDRAFDRGLMTITPEYVIRFAKQLVSRAKGKKDAAIVSGYEGKSIRLPRRFLPNREFLEFHNKNIFLGA
jgi:predicted restriction endonuclease